MIALAAAMPIRGLLGGLMIGSAAGLMLLSVGRIAGVSGLAARALSLGGETPWPVATAFVAGLPLGASVALLAGDGIATRFPASWVALLAGGLLVGFGTRLGGGCTSGHGVCGLSRLSARSIAATLCFMTAGFATVAAWRMSGLPW